MAKTLMDSIQLIENNDRCVLLKVKDNMKMNMILLGCFDGDEDMIRIAKDETDTITVFRQNGKSFSWGRNTLVTNQLSEMRKLIMEAIRFKGWW